MTLLEILNEVLLLSGMEEETAFAGNDDDAVRRMVSVANQAAVSIAQWEWQGLRSIYSFVMSTDTAYEFPSDYRALIPDTTFIDGFMVNLPTETSTWNYMQSIAGAAGALWDMRIMGDRFQIYNPVAGTEVNFEYQSKYPILDSSGVAKAKFTADTDTFRIDDDLLIKEVLWRYKKLMGHPDWQVDMADAKAYERYARGNDKGSKTLTPGTCDVRLGEPYTPLWV